MQYGIGSAQFRNHTLASTHHARSAGTALAARPMPTRLQALYVRVIQYTRPNQLPPFCRMNYIHIHRDRIKFGCLTDRSFAAAISGLRTRKHPAIRLGLRYCV